MQYIDDEYELDKDLKNIKNYSVKINALVNICMDEFEKIDEYDIGKKLNDKLNDLEKENLRQQMFIQIVLDGLSEIQSLSNAIKCKADKIRRAFIY